MDGVAPDVAYMTGEMTMRGMVRRVVRWDEVMAERREHQRRTLEIKRRGDNPVRAYKVWVAYYDMNLMGGWQAFIEHRGGHEWIDRDRRWLRPRLMALFPLVIPLGRKCNEDGIGSEGWDLWKAAFAEQYARRRQCGKPVGVRYCWWDGSDNLRIARVADGAMQRWS